VEPNLQSSDRPSAVLFACNMNAVRSPMAAAILRHLAGNTIYVESAGVHRGEQNPFAVAIMEEIGIDLSQHQPQQFADLFDTSFDLIISLTPQAHHRAMEMTRTMALETEYWPTHDPTIVTGNREQVLSAFRDLRDNLFKKIKARFDFHNSPEP